MDLDYIGEQVDAMWQDAKAAGIEWWEKAFREREECEKAWRIYCATRQPKLGESLTWKA